VASNIGANNPGFAYRIASPIIRRLFPSPDRAARTALMLADAVPVFAEPGWLVTIQNDRLVAQRFDAGRGRVAGKPVVLEKPESPYAMALAAIAGQLARRVSIQAHAAAVPSAV